MNLGRKSSFLATILCLALLPALLPIVGDDDFPRFKPENDRESKVFATRVGTAIIKAARSSPRKIELKDHSFTTPRADRKLLTLKMTYSGAITKVTFKVEISMLLDTQDQQKWEVLNIRYWDSNKSPVPYSEKKVQNLIKKFND